MIDRLRFLLDRPLDPLAARAVVVFATATLLGFAALFVLGSGESSRPVASGQRAAQPQPVRSLSAVQAEAAPVVPLASRRRRQDPQDEKRSAAGRRAAKILRSHRALQHVPYRHGRLTVRLVGARGDRAVLAVSAPTIPAARRGWRQFLRRYSDAGRAYAPLFRVRGGHTSRGGA
jgi:hypothetical protein